MGTGWGTARQDTGSLVSRENSPVTEQSAGISKKPSVIRESENPSLSISEVGVSAANRLKMMSVKRIKNRTLWFLNMADALLEERDDVRINDAVENFLAVAAGLDDMHLPQPAHVVRDG